MGKRLRRIPTASKETDVSVALIRKMLERKELTRYRIKKHGGLVFVDVNELLRRFQAQ